MIAKSDQIFFPVIARVTAEFLVVDLKVVHCSTALAPPTIPPRNSRARCLDGLGANSGGPWLSSNWVHDALGRNSCRKACCCWRGRNLKNLVIENSSVSGSPLSRLAPARKSAQIISRQ